MDSFDSGAHPLKKLRRQTMEEFEEEFMNSGKPSATVINMRQKQLLETVEPVIQEKSVFMGIKERESLQATVESSAMPKKKQSLFAMKKAGKILQTKPTKVEETKESFPSSFKVYDHQPQTLKPTIQIQPTNFTKAGLQDASIDEENIKTINQMTPEEIMQAQKFLIEQLGSKHKGALSKFKSNFGKPIDQPQPEPELQQENDSVVEPIKPKIGSGSISEQVQKQASEMEQTCKLSRQISINQSGQITLKPEQEEQEDLKYLSYITNEDFEQLDCRFFNLNEIANLLASSDLRQRVFSLNLLQSAVSRELTDKEFTYVFGVALNPDYPEPYSICSRLDQQIRTSANRLDFFLTFMRFINSALDKIFSHVRALAEESLVKQIDGKGLKLFQCYLADMVQGKVIFDNSYLVKGSKQCYPFLESIMEKTDLLDLLRQSLKKVFDVAIETQNCDCLTEAFKFLSWLSIYSSQTQACAQSLFNLFIEPLAQICLHKDYPQVNFLYQIATHLLLAKPNEDQSKLIYMKLIEPSLQIFSRDSLKELEDSQASKTLPFLNLLNLCSRISSQLITKEVLGGELLQPFIQISKNSDNPSILTSIINLFESLPKSQRDILEPCITLIGEKTKGFKDKGLIIRSLSNFDFFEVRDILVRNEEPKALQATLSALNDVKMALFKKLKKGDNVLQTVQLIMKLLNRDDEPLLLSLLKEYVFDPDNILNLKTKLSGETYLTLLNFYLGYCTSEEKVKQVNKKEVNFKQLQTQGFFLPLLDDWFIRPLYFIEKISEQAAENLTCAIMQYAISYYKTSDGDLLRVTQSELVMLIADMLNKQTEKPVFGPRSLEMMDQFINTFFTINDKVITIKHFHASNNQYLSEAYKKTFLQSNFVQTLSSFYNQNPADQNKMMYKILLLSLQTTGLSFESRKTLLSELFEVLPCLIRLERELFHELFNGDSQAKEINCSMYLGEVEFYSNFALRLKQRVDIDQSSPLLKILLQ